MQWTDPRAKDWKDGLSPLIRAAFGHNQYVSESLDEPLMQALRRGPAEMHVYALPGDSTGPLAPNATFDATLSLRPNSWLVGFSASSQQAEGFTAQVTDPASGQTLFSTPVHNQNLAGLPVLYCPMPLALGSPQIAARLLNLSPNPNLVQLCLWIISETG